MKMFRKIPWLVIGICYAVTCHGNVSLPAIIGSHMVLQQRSEVMLWGWCDPMEEVNIHTSWDSHDYNTKGTNDAKWGIKIKTPLAGGPYCIKISGNNKIELKDVLIGEVWLCAGQSNMALSASSGIRQAIDEIPHANNNQIRLFYVEKRSADYPQEDCKGHWVVCNPEDFKRFSSVGYFFGKKLQENLHYPVGLINASWEGTSAEDWTPAELIEGDSTLHSAANKVWKSDEWWPSKPGVCYNAMIHPITHFTIAGAIWYQGESNSDAATSYQQLFSTQIASWRTAWQQNFSFYYVQIAPYSGYAANDAGARLREAQSKCKAISRTGMVVIYDLINDVNEIHPQNKRDVGFRLANFALGDTYHLIGIVYKSPDYQGMEIEKNKIRLSFNNAEKGLLSKGGSPREFFIAGADRKFLPATAKIEGNKVVVYNPGIKKPIAVRFGFSNAAIPNLFSKEGLPVNTFRTDNW